MNLDKIWEKIYDVRHKIKFLDNNLLGLYKSLQKPVKSRVVTLWAFKR